MNRPNCVVKFGVIVPGILVSGIDRGLKDCTLQKKCHDLREKGLRKSPVLHYRRQVKIFFPSGASRSSPSDIECSR